MPGRDTPLRTLLDLSLGHGLEVGPLDRPIAVRPESDVLYLDLSDQATLRADHADDDGVVVDDIPTIDFWLQHDGEVVTLAEASAPGAPYDWVLASHVIEHIPDVVGWLGQLRDITHDRAEIALSVPDRRFCFDIHRPATTVGQALEAHEREDRTPPLRAIFDHRRAAVEVAAIDAWAGRIPDVEERTYTWEHTLSLLERSRRGEYVDSHVWLWTPREFVAFFDDLCRLGMIDFVVDRMLPTAHNDLEFHVVLARVPAGLSATERDDLRTSSHATVLADLPPERNVSTPIPSAAVEEPLAGRVEELQAELDMLQVRVARQSERISTLRDKLSRSRRQRDRARQRVRRLQTRLTSQPESPASRGRLAGVLGRVKRRLSR